MGLQGYTFFLIFALKQRLWVLVRTASLRRFYRVPTINVLSKNKKKKTHYNFSSENYFFTAVKNCCILHGRVFVMRTVNPNLQFGFLLNFDIRRKPLSLDGTIKIYFYMAQFVTTCIEFCQMKVTWCLACVNKLHFRNHRHPAILHFVRRADGKVQLDILRFDCLLNDKHNDSCIKCSRNNNSSQGDTIIALLKTHLSVL